MYIIIVRTLMALGHLEGRENDASQRMPRELESIITSASTLPTSQDAVIRTPDEPQIGANSGINAPS